MSWIDRVVQFPNRVKLTAVSGQDNVYDVEANEGNVYVEGTLLNAENLTNETIELIHQFTEELLWTNPSPTAAFSPQTIALDLSGYDEIRIVYKSANDQNVLHSDIGEVGKGMQLFHMNTTGGNYLELYWRSMNVGSSGVVVSNGITQQSGYYRDSNNYVIIPYKIYGILK